MIVNDDSGQPPTATTSGGGTRDGLWPWMEQEQRAWLLREQVMWLRREAETEARGSRDFGRGFMYAVALLAKEGDVDAGSTGSVRPE